MNQCSPRRLLAALWISTGLALAPTVAAAPLPEIVLAGSEEVKNSFHGEWLQLIYDEAFRRLGYRLVYTPYPANRVGAMSDQGIVAGEINRIADYGENHPNLVRVDEAHFSMRFAAFAIGPKPVLNGWASLKGTTYRVEYRRGVAAAMNALPAIVPEARLSSVASAPIGLRKLIYDRTDVFVDLERVVERYLTDEEFKDAKIKNLGTMEERQFHAFLHRNHAQLSTALARVLRGMKSEGLIEQFRIKAEAKSK
jgi:polar amino acid transport system substrate-binding protein